MINYTHPYRQLRYQTAVCVKNTEIGFHDFPGPFLSFLGLFSGDLRLGSCARGSRLHLSWRH